MIVDFSKFMKLSKVYMEYDWKNFYPRHNMKTLYLK